MQTLYVDESKVGGYSMIAVPVKARSAVHLRKTIVRLRLNGQSRLHMVKESDRRRRQILSALCDAEVTAVVYTTRGLADGLARRLCLQYIVRDALRSAVPVSRIVLERDETMVALDKRALFAEVSRADTGAGLSYAHEKASHEPLLCVPDAIGWAHLRGGEWRSRSSSLVSAVRQLG